MNICECNKYSGGEIPPCSIFLGNVNPIIKDGKVIFRNENRIFCFISTTFSKENTGDKCGLENYSKVTNLQISLTTFLIGIYINEVQKGNIKHSPKNSIHNNEKANSFINDTLNKDPNVIVDYVPELKIVISNSNAILSLYTSSITITPLNYYILFILNRFENDPGLFFGNNSYVTDDPINFCLATLNILYPFC